MATAKKWVYFFESSNAEGNASMKGLLGGKGAGLAEMSNIGIPVPPGFTISTETCVYYSTHDKTYPDGLEAEIDKNLNRLEETIGKRFGDKENPLLVSVRSGAKFSMPGMMDTVLNLGLNDDTVAGMANKTGNGRFAYDSYRRFIQMFGNVVLEIEHHDFENILNVVKKENGIKLDTELTVDNLKDVIGRYKEMTRRKKGIDFPAVPREQLKLSIKAVFDSWNNPRAITYREINRIPDDLGTAVNVQMMVFGNMGANSGTGVAFTRDPSTGEKRFVGEYLINAQGEDVVAGIRTPSPISKLKEEMPDVFDQLEGIYRRLESHYRDMQDIEFTTEEGKLYLLQTRTGKRTAASALKIAVDMADEKLISKEEAVSRVDPLAIDKLLHPQIDPEEEKKYEIIARGLSASPGVATGVAVLSADKAVKLTKGSDKGVITVKEETIGPADNPSSVEGILGETFVLVSSETTPEDIAGMEVSQGILTARGGMTSHAAIVARERGKAAVVGCESIEIDDKNKLFKVGDIIIREGDFITIDGSTGKVFKGKIPTIDSEIIRVLRGETPSSELYKYYD
ncbi:MAG: PEP/pyruvate-binding domain-containing protein, partial [Thermodesulfobacteriota bacterium]